MGCANVYTTAFDLTKTTRIGHYDGGFVGNITIGHKTVPLGGSGVYIEIESIVDPFATADVTRRPWWYKRAVAVKNCRSIGKRDMIHNSATPNIVVDPETYDVRADGELLTCEPAEVLPLAQRYFLF